MIKVPKWNDKVLLVLLSITVVSEVFLLNQNFALKEKVSAYHRLEELLTQAQARLERNVSISTLIGKCLPFFSQDGFNGEADGISEEKGSRFILMFCFTLQDCAYCLKNEIITWNEFYKSYNQEVCQVIGVTDTVGIENIDQVVSSMHIQFPVFSVPNLHSYLAEYSITSTPAVFFGDGTSKRIIYSHFPTTANLSSDGFTGKLQMILDACKH